MIPERARARTRPDLLTVLGSTASACGFSVNSVLVHLGDAFGLYPTGQYSFDHELPTRRGQALAESWLRHSHSAPVAEAESPTAP